MCSSLKVDCHMFIMCSYGLKPEVGHQFPERIDFRSAVRPDGDNELEDTHSRQCHWRRPDCSGPARAHSQYFCKYTAWHVCICASQRAHGIPSLSRGCGDCGGWVGSGWRAGLSRRRPRHRAVALIGSTCRRRHGVEWRWSALLERRWRAEIYWREEVSPSTA